VGIDSPHDGSDASDKKPDQRTERDIGRAERSETSSRADYADELRRASRSQDRNVRPPAAERPEWQGPLARGEVDQVGSGIVDERASRFSPQERRIADYLAKEGAAVVAVHDGYGRDGRKPDSLVDDTETEFKSLDPGAGNTRVKAQLNDAKGQARDALLDARNSGLRKEEAELGMERFLGSKYGHRLDAIRIIGDDYDINWKRD
jgi:hypothetical protein